MRDWKRYEEAKRLRDAGLTLKAVGEALGVSAERVRGMLATLDRRDRFKSRAVEDPPLPQWWHGLKATTRSDLEDKGFDSRAACMSLAADELTMWRGSVALPGWENEKSIWGFSKRKLSLATVNEVRAWLGVPPYVPRHRAPSAAELQRAQRLLERNGWRVEPPK